MSYRKRLFPTLAAVPAIAVLLLAGCSGEDPESQPSITQQQAAARVDQILRATSAAITPRPRLAIDKPGTNTGPCADEPDGMSDARVQATGEYYLEDIPQQARASVGQQILRLWKAKGYTIDDTFRMGTSSAEIHGNTQDGFLIALEVPSGRLTIGATSPCVWPNGTPLPPGTIPS